LANAELAYNEVDDILYYGKGTGGAGGTASTIPAIAGPGAYATLTTTQTISGDKSFTGTVTAVTQATSDNSTKLATTAFVKSLGFTTGNDTITLTGDVTGSGTNSITTTLANSGVTAGTYTKVTVDVKGRVTSGTTLSATDIPTLTASKISDFDTQVRTSRLDQMAAPTVAVSFNSQRITDLATPTADTDAANKAYVDAARQGLDVKDSVRVATTANITLSGTQTIDGIAVVAGDRVLVKNQTTGSANGIYVVAAGAWTRSTDANTNAKVTAGMFTFVEQGTTNADSGWVLSTPNPITLGTTALTFTQFSGAGQITAGAGLTKTGNTLDVGAGTGIAVAADSVGLTGQALALHNLATNGFFVRTGASTVTARSIATSGNGISLTNGDGVAGNPTITLSAALSSVGGLTPAADRIAYYTGATTAALATLTAFGRSLIDDANAAAGRTTLGLGTIATQDANNVNITGGSIDNITFDGGTF
jgi:phage-related tail fiber protein